MERWFTKKIKIIIILFQIITLFNCSNNKINYNVIEFTSFKRSENLVTLDSLKKVYPYFYDSVSVDSSNYFLVNKIGDDIVDILLFNSDKVFVQYLFYPDKNSVLYEISFDENFNATRNTGKPFVSLDRVKVDGLNEVNKPLFILENCTGKREFHVFTFVMIKPPLFDVSFDLYSKQANNDKYELFIEHNFNENKREITLNDSTFTKDTWYQMCLILKNNNQIIRDTIFFKKEVCIEGKKHTF